MTEVKIWKTQDEGTSVTFGLDSKVGFLKKNVFIPCNSLPCTDSVPDLHSQLDELGETHGSPSATITLTTQSLLHTNSLACLYFPTLIYSQTKTFPN